jgi:ribosomal-protein-alanine N-acetyltransferase
MHIKITRFAIVQNALFFCLPGPVNLIEMLFIKNYIMLDLQLSPFRNLETKRLILRRLRIDDAADWFAIRSDARTYTFIQKNLDASINDTIEVLKRIDASFLTNDVMGWAITLKGSDRLIGVINFWNINKAHHRAEIGYTLHHDHWNKGIMGEALEVALDFGFTQLKFHTVEANINPENTGSRKVLEKNGFVREGYFKENYFYNGDFYDSAVYSKLAPK